jgi:hypothetical protein
MAAHISPSRSKTVRIPAASVSLTENIPGRWPAISGPASPVWRCAGPIS